MTRTKKRAPFPGKKGVFPEGKKSLPQAKERDGGVVFVEEKIVTKDSKIFEILESIDGDLHDLEKLSKNRNSSGYFEIVEGKLSRIKKSEESEIKIGLELTSIIEATDYYDSQGLLSFTEEAVSKSIVKKCEYGIGKLREWRALELECQTETVKASEVADINNSFVELVEIFKEMADLVDQESLAKVEKFKSELDHGKEINAKAQLAVYRNVVASLASAALEKKEENWSFSLALSKIIQSAKFRFILTFKTFFSWYNYAERKIREFLSN